MLKTETHGEKFEIHSQGRMRKKLDIGILMEMQTALGFKEIMGLQKVVVKTRDFPLRCLLEGL
jgi:hypothetical protein